MDLNKYKELLKKFESRNYEKDTQVIDKTLFYSSWFGNLLSVIFAFFFVNSLVDQAAVHFSGQHIILPVFIILFLSMFELLKRFVFGNITTTLLVAKNITLKIVIGVIFALLLIAGSFYLSMSGAQQYVNKSDIIKTNSDSLIVSQVIKLDSTYQTEIKKIESRINFVYESAQTRKRITLTRSEVKDIKLWEEEVKGLKQEKESKIKELKLNTLNKQTEQLAKSNNSQFAFLLLSGFIELIILIGVSFRQFYSYTSFKQMKEKLDNNPNFHQLETYKSFLQILFNNGKTTNNSELPSFRRFFELVNTKSRIKHTQVSVKKFLSTIEHLNIIYTTSKKKYTKVSFDQAVDILSNYIPLEDER